MPLFVLGNACLDVTYHLGSLPLAGETVNALSVTRDLGGKGLIQAIAAHRAGADVRFIAPVGRDVTADAIERVLAEEGLRGGGLIVCEGVSDSSIIMLDRAGENAIVSDTAQAEALTPEQVGPLLRLEPTDALLLQGNLSQSLTTWAIARANAVGARVIINAAPVRPWLSQISGLISVGVANAVEAMAWTAVTSARAAITAIDAGLAVITTGGKGCLLRLANGALFEFIAPSVDVVDTTGAGDAFTGTFAAEWLVTGDPVASARLAVHAASDMVTRFGAASALPTRDSIHALRAALARDAIRN
jgi:ribokinase